MSRRDERLQAELGTPMRRTPLHLLLLLAHVRRVRGGGDEDGARVDVGGDVVAAEELIAFAAEGQEVVDVAAGEGAVCADLQACHVEGRKQEEGRGDVVRSHSDPVASVRAARLPSSFIPLSSPS